MSKKLIQTQSHRALIRRYLLWFYKTTKENFERVERKTTQLKVDRYVLGQIKATPCKVSPRDQAEYNAQVKEFEAYIKTKEGDELKLKFSDDKGKSLHPQYVYLKNRLEAVEAAIKHFLGNKELKTMRTLYEKEFTTRILQAREH